MMKTIPEEEKIEEEKEFESGLKKTMTRWAT